jgi:hypothetical protein
MCSPESQFLQRQTNTTTLPAARNTARTASADSRVCEADGAGWDLCVCIEPPVHGISCVGQQCADGITCHLVAARGNTDHGTAA